MVRDLDKSMSPENLQEDVAHATKDIEHKDPQQDFDSEILAEQLDAERCFRDGKFGVEP